MLAALLAPLLALAPSQAADLHVPSDLPAGTPPAHTFEVTRVVDGDTIWIERGGEREKLRLLNVDTEEKISSWHPDSTSKPQTVFGEETKIWAKELFESIAEPGERPRVGLLFPGGREVRGRYGRLLAEVILPDGTDYNLLLVRTGRSPYFTKYGRSEIRHDDFVRAQERARAEQLGIWNPKTNEPRTPGTPAAKRDYASLLPWWEARADAIDAFRARRAHPSPSDPPVGAADSPADLARLLDASADGDVEVFGTIARFFEERDGSLTALFDTSEGATAFRAVLPAPPDPDLVAFLRRSKREGVQNYLLVRGRVVHGPRGFRMVEGRADAWRPAGPEPHFDPRRSAPAEPSPSQRGGRR